MILGPAWVLQNYEMHFKESHSINHLALQMNFRQLCRVKEMPSHKVYPRLMERMTLGQVEFCRQNTVSFYSPTFLGGRNALLSGKFLLTGRMALGQVEFCRQNTVFICPLPS